MFNMKKTTAKEEKSSRPLFDLEKDMQDLSQAQKITADVQDKVHKLNVSLREGSDKESFEKQQALLAGYIALQKVLGRINRKMV
ncbi:hypothetical protein CP10139811_0777 [Chlamydia ibidis]|uniref:Uncharacterized protein n=2 Tax=Chlamydia ibidis TaxID=1405396 RepID=S7KEW9_9CHLA|nr:DUF5398 family protein [Chlamydia ibidis]EPP34716.1 hypothetical protein CP10139811_0777 [Chlamydia ibidis]EQM62814.1 hypothetical protein H359_0098 [Chlamydia ibidis 10-1398/6]